MRQISRESRSALVLLTLSLWLVSAHAAPAPAPRRAPCRARIPTTCVLTWNGTDYDAAFVPGGAYHATRGACHWRGTWRLEGRRLVVRERLDGGSAAIDWSVELGPRLREGPGVRLTD